MPTFQARLRMENNTAVLIQRHEPKKKKALTKLKLHQLQQTPAALLCSTVNPPLDVTHQSSVTPTSHSARINFALIDFSKDG